MSKARLALSTVFVVTLGTLLLGCREEPPKPPPPPPEPGTCVQFEQGLSADEIEQKHPLTDDCRAKLTPESVAKLEQWQVNQLYARLEGRAIPNGPWQGRFFFAEGGGVREIGQVFQGLPTRILDRFVNFKLDQLTEVGKALWKGKVFYKEEGVLRNMIDREGIVEKIFNVDPSEVRTEVIDGREVALLFPAALYCGESLNDPRRESGIIDYSVSDTIEGYIPNVDFLAAKDGLNIRDEIRFVRPGFYLGLAYYLDGKLLLTFTLYNEEQASSGVTPEPECWDGRGPRPGEEEGSEA